MNGLLLLSAFMATVNPPRTRLGLPERDDGRGRLPEIALGAVVAFGVVVGLAWLSGPILDALEVSAETFRIAAGLVVGVAGLRSMVRTAPGPEPELPGRRAALWPVAFPRLVTPETVILALAAGAQEGVSGSAVSLGAAFVVVVALGMLSRRAAGDGFLRWAGALLGVVAVVVGAVLMIDGIRDV